MEDCFSSDQMLKAPSPMSQCSRREPTVKRDGKGLGKEQHQKRYLLQTFHNLGMRGEANTG